MWSRSPPASTTSTERTFSRSEPEPIRAYPHPVPSQPAADGGLGRARGVDRSVPLPLRRRRFPRTIGKRPQARPRPNPLPDSSGSPYVAHPIETHSQDPAAPCQGRGSGARAPAHQRSAWCSAGHQISDWTSWVFSGHTEAKGCSACGSASLPVCGTKAGSEVFFGRF